MIQHPRREKSSEEAKPGDRAKVVSASGHPPFVLGWFSLLLSEGEGKVMPCPYCNVAEATRAVGKVNLNTIILLCAVLFKA